MGGVDGNAIRNGFEDYALFVVGQRQLLQGPKDGRVVGNDHPHSRCLDSLQERLLRKVDGQKDLVGVSTRKGCL